MASLLRILLLAALLMPRLSRAVEVCNAGFPGENSAQLLQRMPEVLSNCPRPAVLVLFVGMNDAVNEKRFLTPGETEKNVTAILQAVTSAGVRPVVITVHMPDLVRLMQRHTAQAYGARSPAIRIDQANRALRRAATLPHATVVDFHAILARAGGASAALSTDGVHLTATGYRLLASSVASGLPADTRAGTILCLGDSLTYGTGVRLPGAPDAGSASYPQQLKALLNNGS